MFLGCGTSTSVFSAIEAMKEKGHNLYLMSSFIDEYYKNKLSKLGISYSLAPLSQYRKNIISFLKSILYIKVVILREKIEIVHSHHRWNCLIGTICAKLTHIKSITSDHVILYGKKYLSFWADGIITDSNYNKKHLVEYFHIPENKIEIVYPLIERERYGKLIDSSFKINNAMNEFDKFKTENTLLVGQMARLSAEKGQIYFLEVIKEVLKDFNNVKFLFLGEGNLKHALIEKAKDMMLAENVYFLGLKKNIYSFLAVLDIFVISSKIEGFCISASEAILAGIPIIATKTGGLPEQIIDGETGFLIEYGDKKSLRDRLLLLLCNKELRKRMGERGRQYLLKKYSYEKIAENLEEKYNFFLKDIKIE
jgi:glycosyltransferase involved in cell wall biosynthesis